jgi:uncharacterized protein YbaR (Trm112 family)
MGTTKICDFLLSSGQPHILVCPRCKSKRLEAITIKRENGKQQIVKLVCRSFKCKNRVAYDVTAGFPTR